MGSQRPTQAVGCNFPCYRVIFDVDNAKDVDKVCSEINAKKEYKIFQKERLQTLITKITLLLVKLLDFNGKKYFAVMQSGNVV